MMGHTKEEEWIKKREELRGHVADYYKARKTVRALQIELGIKNLPKLDPWLYKTPSLREVAQLLRRASISIKSDKLSFGLDEGSASKILKQSLWCGIVKRFRFQIDPVDEQVQSVEGTYELLLDVAKDQSIQVATVPKYFDDLVVKKGILHVTGRVTFKKARSWGEKKFNDLVVLNARELRGNWLEDAGIRAFRVVVLPSDDREQYQPVLGYVVRSSVTNEIVPAFNADITKAVSLCNRRVKAQVLKQMDL